MKDTDYSLQVNLPSRDKSLGMSERLLCSHPKEILAAGLSIAEKREILSSWASDARAVPDTPSLRTLDNGAVVGVHEILDALRALDSLESPRISPMKMNKSRRRRGFLELLTATSRKGRRDDDDDPPPCPAVISPLPRLPPLGMHAELEAA
jgi:hypothetical protein